MNLFERHPQRVAGLAGAVLVLAVIQVFRTVSGREATEPIRAYYDSVSEQARQTSAYLKSGGKVVVLAFDAEVRSEHNAPLQRMIDTLKADGLTVLHVERLVKDYEAGWKDVGGFPYQEFLRVATRYPKADAVVSLCGAPYLDPDSPWPDPARLPPLLVPRAVERSPGLSALLEEGRVAMAVVPSKQAPPRQGEGGGAGLFDQNFEVLTHGAFEARAP